MSADGACAVYQAAPEPGADAPDQGIAQQGMAFPADGGGQCEHNKQDDTARQTSYNQYPAECRIKMKVKQFRGGCTQHYQHGTKDAYKEVVGNPVNKTEGNDFAVGIDAVTHYAHQVYPHHE